ncbi:MAG: SPOR domain-containing protein [Gemmatimonadota bacterium]
MIARPSLVTLVGLAVACAGPYAERPPSSADREAPRPAAEAETPRGPEGPAADAGETTVVGHVTPDGRFHADTGSATADPVPVERQTVVTGTVRTAPADAGPAVAVPPDLATLTIGYRVQIFAARDRSTAAGVARRLEDRLEGQPVYVERVDPWYKVQVGDFATPEEAEPLRARLALMGYAEAWTARTTIRAAQ